MKSKLNIIYLDHQIMTDSTSYSQLFTLNDFEDQDLKTKCESKKLIHLIESLERNSRVNEKRKEIQKRTKLSLNNRLERIKNFKYLFIESV